MNKTLKAFFIDGIYPFEEVNPKDPEYREITRKISEENQYFRQKMSPDDAQRFEAL